MPSFTSKRARILLAVGVVFIFLFLASRPSFQMLVFGACACDSCVAELGQDPWFRQRYNPSVRLLLTKWNWELSDDLYGWWQKLQRKSQGNYKAVVGTLFSLFANDHDPLDAGPGRCRRCAVVGNSGNLKRSRYGPLIDAHDLVIRINQGPTEGFEKDVGFRTTHRIIYPESAVDLDNSTHLVLVPFKILDLQWLISIFTTKHISRTYVPVKRTIKASKDKVMILHPVFLKYIRDQWLLKHGRYPSTGFVSIILAMHMCDQVSVFGFGADGKGNWHHYFEETKEPKDVVNHDRGYEHRLTLQLHQKRRITLYTGW